MHTRQLSQQKVSHEEAELLSAYLRLPPDDREKVIAFAARLQAEQHSPSPSAAPLR